MSAVRAVLLALVLLGAALALAAPLAVTGSDADPPQVAAFPRRAPRALARRRAPGRFARRGPRTGDAGRALRHTPGARRPASLRAASGRPRMNAAPDRRAPAPGDDH
jgi:hypothetical protein